MSSAAEAVEALERLNTSFKETNAQMRQFNKTLRRELRKAYRHMLWKATCNFIVFLFALAGIAWIGFIALSVFGVF